MKEVQKLTEYDKNQIRNFIKGQFKFTLWVLLIIIIFVFSLFLFSIIVGENNIDPLRAVFYILISIFCLWIFFIFLLAWRMILAVIEIWQNQKYVIRDKVEKIYLANSHSEAARYEMIIYDESFYLKPQDHTYAESNGAFEIHYTPLNKTLLLLKRIE